MGGGHRQRMLVALACAACRLDPSGQAGSGDEGVADEGTTAGTDVTSGESGASSTASASGSASAGMSASTEPDPSETDPAPDTSSADAGDTAATTEPDPTTGADDGMDDTGTPGAICGNGMIEDGEQCETNDLGGNECSDKGGGFVGEPACSGCQVDLGPCCLEAGRGCVVWNDECCGTCILFVCA